MYKYQKKHYKTLNLAVEDIVNNFKQSSQEKMIKYIITNEKWHYVIHFLCIRESTKYEHTLVVYKRSITKPQFLQMSWGVPYLYLGGQEQTYLNYNLSFAEAEKELQKNSLFLSKLLDNSI